MLDFVGDKSRSQSDGAEDDTYCSCRGGGVGGGSQAAGRDGGLEWDIMDM